MANALVAVEEEYGTTRTRRKGEKVKRSRGPLRLPSPFSLFAFFPSH
jgi:hypothetical protein